MNNFTRFFPVGARKAAAFCFTLALLALSQLCLAQPFSINWHKISGGGGTGVAGPYTISGTIGQHDAGGPAAGGNYTVTGGFWSFVSIVQSTGAPTLLITNSGNQVIVYWQNTGTWTLQQNSDLTVPTGWAPSSGVVLSNGTNYLTLTNPVGNLFFRLKN